MPILDRIKFDGVGNNENWLVYKMKPENIAWGSQLIVGTGQEALFIKGGRVLDVFTSGTYTLRSGNLPLLRELMSLPFGGQSPFSAEIVFINTTSNLGLKWGTNSPINVEDPKYGLIIGLRAFGQFGIKVVDTRLFMSQLIGTIQLDSGFNHNIIMQQFNSLINTRLKTMLMKFVSQNQISFLQIAEYYEQLSSDALRILRGDFSNSGLELINFFIESVSPPKNEYEKLRVSKEELALGERFYDKRRTFDVLEAVAGSPMGGIYAAPVMGNYFGQLSQNASSNSGTSQSSQGDSSSEAGVKCPSCQNTVEVGSKFCRFCGKPIPQKKFCTACGKQLDADAQFCSNCGKKCD